MKPEGQVKHKLAQVRFRHLKREIRNGLSRRSLNCVHNGAVEMPGVGEVGVCLKGAESGNWNGGVCDESVSDRAAQCPLFERCRSRNQIEDDFNAFLGSAERALIAERYPDMAALLWVLDLDRPEEIVDLGDEDILSPEYTPISERALGAAQDPAQDSSYIVPSDVLLPEAEPESGPASAGPAPKKKSRKRKPRRV